MTKLFIYLSLPIETQFCSSVQVNKESSASESKLLLKTENKYSEADLQEVIILLIREVLASLEKDLQPSVLTLEWKLVDKWVIRLERERNDAVLSTEAFCRGPQYDLIHFTVKDSIKIDTNRHQERNFDDKEGKLKIGRAKHRCTVDGRSDALNKARPEAGGRVGKEKGINSLKLLLWIEENNLPGRSAQNQASKLHILQVPPLLLPLLFRLPPSESIPSELQEPGSQEHASCDWRQFLGFPQPSCCSSHPVPSVLRSPLRPPEKQSSSRYSAKMQM